MSPWLVDWWKREHGVSKTVSHNRPPSWYNPAALAANRGVFGSANDVKYHLQAPKCAWGLPQYPQNPTLSRGYKWEKTTKLGREFESKKTNVPKKFHDTRYYKYDGDHPRQDKGFPFYKHRWSPSWGPNKTDKPSAEAVARSHDEFVDYLWVRGIVYHQGSYNVKKTLDSWTSMTSVGSTHYIVGIDATIYENISPDWMSIHDGTDFKTRSGHHSVGIDLCAMAQDPLMLVPTNKKNGPVKTLRNTKDHKLR